MFSNTETERERALGPGFAALFRPYFHGIDNAELRVPQCRSCNHFQFPPRSLCLHCHSHDIGYEKIDEPTGTLFSWTVVHHAKGTDFEPLAPYAAALISLDEIRIRLYGLIHDPTDLKIGRRVRLLFPTAENPGPTGQRPHWVLTGN